MRDQHAGAAEMKKCTTDFVLAAVAVAGALLLSVPHWWDVRYWLESRAWWAVYFFVGLVVALYVVYAVVSAIHTLFARHAISRGTTASGSKSVTPVWIASLAMGAAFVLGGAAEVFSYWALGLDWFTGDINAATAPHDIILLVFSSVLAVATALVVSILLVVDRRVDYDVPSIGASSARSAPPATRLRSNYPANGYSRYLIDMERDEVRATAIGDDDSDTGWSRSLGRFEVSAWLLAIGCFGAIIAVWFIGWNASTAAAAHSMLPYLLGAIGYTGLFFSAVVFASRFLAATRASGPTIHPQAGATARTWRKIA
jgi:hypothetical protein